MAEGCIHMHWAMRRHAYADIEYNKNPEPKNKQMVLKIISEK